MLPSITPNQLPHADQLWKKVRQDLSSGFKIHGVHPHYHDIIRVYTHLPNQHWQFLLIANSNRTMPPVFSLEMHIYPPESETYQLKLSHLPIPQPRWTHTWHTLQNMTQTDQLPQSDRQSHIIKTYLESQVDTQQTQHAFTRVNYPKHRVTWLSQK